MIILRKQGSTTSSTTACSFALFTGVIVILLAFWTDALVPIIRSSRLLFAASATQLCSTPSPEQAKEMMELLIKANEEKKQAVAETEAKYQAIIEDLQRQLEETKSVIAQSTTADVSSIPKSYHPPATNKVLTEKIAAYQKFISEYIVQAQLEKQQAVAAAEQKIREEVRGSTNRKMDATEEPNSEGSE